MYVYGVVHSCHSEDISKKNCVNGLQLDHVNNTTSQRRSWALPGFKTGDWMHNSICDWHAVPVSPAMDAHSLESQVREKLQLRQTKSISYGD